MADAFLSVHRIEAGLPVTTLVHGARRAGVTEDRFRVLARISATSLVRRRASGKFTPEESDRVARLRRVTEETIRFFEGDVDAARRWLAKPAAALGEVAPLDLLINDAGVREVENLLGRLEQGVFT